MKNKENLDYLFYPRSIAIAGVSNNVNKFNGGYRFLKALTGFGYKGRIYPMNPDGGEIEGRKIFRRVKEIPGKVDYVISAIPARNTPQLVTDCVEKGVKAIHFFTSGFGEIESEEGVQLQTDIISRAMKGGIRVIGPNCLGIYCPSGGLSFTDDFSRKCGSVGMISQSGGNAVHCVREGNEKGIYFSKVISMGNGADLNESDFLEYMTRDKDTRIITAYIEGVRQGLRFFKALKVASAKKPVIVLKVGRSESGARIARAHTAALAGSDQVWEGAFRQTGAIRANSIEEMMDITMTFQRMPVPHGNRIVICGIGGGASVIMADEFARAGLALPTVDGRMRKSLISLFGSEAGRIFRNPIDFNDFKSPETFFRFAKKLDGYEGTDVLVFHVAFDHFGLIAVNEKKFVISGFIKLIKSIKGELKKPLAVILHSYPSDFNQKLAHEVSTELISQGMTVFPSMQRAAAALSKYVRYYENKRKTVPPA